MTDYLSENLRKKLSKIDIFGYFSSKKPLKNFTTKSCQTKVWISIEKKNSKTKFMIGGENS